MPIFHVAMTFGEGDAARLIAGNVLAASAAEALQTAVECTDGHELPKLAGFDIAEIKFEPEEVMP